MASTHDIRVLALQALYALDASDGREADAIRALVESGEPLADADDVRLGDKPAASSAPELSLSERRRAFDLAKGAWEARREADEFFADLAPTWPANRQPVIDRSILRLAWQEMHAGKTPPRVVIDEAIGLARAFSTDKSPAFINALLDKALKAFEAAPESDDDGPVGDAGRAAQPSAPGSRSESRAGSTLSDTTSTSPTVRIPAPAPAPTPEP